MDICQAEIAPAISEREPLMVETHQMQNRGVQVVNVNLFFNRSKTEFVRRSVRHSAFDTASGQPDCKSVVIVISTI